MEFVIHRASSALPGAGAYDTAPELWELGNNTPEISVAMTYTAGGLGGYPGIRAAWRIAEVSGMLDTVNDATITVAAPNATIDEYVAVIDCQSLLNGVAATTARVIKVPPGATHVQIQANEVGAAGTPGTLEIRLARNA